MLASQDSGVQGRCHTGFTTRCRCVAVRVGVSAGSLPSPRPPGPQPLTSGAHKAKRRLLKHLNTRWESQWFPVQETGGLASLAIPTRLRTTPPLPAPKPQSAKVRADSVQNNGRCVSNSLPPLLLTFAAYNAFSSRAVPCAWKLALRPWRRLPH